ncbi:MAG: patatin-like phospholipase family protein [Pleomorphochaeta sp.]
MKKKIKLLLIILLLSLSSIYATYPKVALVLSGGGAKGFAEIGVVDEIMKMGIPIDFICGTSMGGLIGAYYALGYSTNDLINILKEDPLINYLVPNTYTKNATPPSLLKDSDGLRLSIGVNSNGIGDVPGFLSDQGVISFLNKTTIKSAGEIDFNDLPIPFKAVAIDSATGKEKILDHGFLSDAMRATMSLPIIFPPYVLKDGTYCMDGGLSDNLPVKVAVDWGADIIISVDVSSEGLKGPGDFSTLSGALVQTINLATFSNREESQALSDILVKPDVSDFMILEVNKIDEILEKGYEAFDQHKEDFIKIRDEIKKYRKLEVKNEDASSIYENLQDPLVKYVKFVDINNDKKYSFTNIFDKYINKRLTPEVLKQLEEDITSFGTINDISTVSFNFNLIDKRDYSGNLEIGLRNWDSSPSKIDFSTSMMMGFSNNPDNRAWAYLAVNAHPKIKYVFADRITADLKLRIAENISVVSKVGYQLLDKENLNLNLFSQFGSYFGSLSPANNKYVKYYIPSYSVGFDVGMGLDFKLSNLFSCETLVNYKLVALGANEYIASNDNSISFEDTPLNIFNFDFTFTYLNSQDTIFANSGYGVNSINSLNITNGELGYYGYFDGSFAYPITKNDTIKAEAKFGFSTANYQLTSSYFDLGGYKELPGYYFGSFTREYFSFSLLYQRYLNEIIYPLYLQAGMKFYGTDNSYNPILNIYPTDTSSMLKAPANKIPSITDLGFGIFTGVGIKTNFGDVIFGTGVSINGNFNIVLEFV